MAKILGDEPIHLGLGATAIPQPPFTDMSWYEAYGARHRQDGAEGRLVSQWHFFEPWTMWEMHPVGAEVVICTAGTLTLIQEIRTSAGAIEQQRTTLRPGEYAINPPGVWHTADVQRGGEGGAAIFITAGLGTEHRPR